MEWPALSLVLGAGIVPAIDNSLILLSVISVLVLMALSAVYRILKLRERPGGEAAKRR